MHIDCQLFEEKFEYKFPLSFTKDFDKIVWRRPIVYVANNHLLLEIIKKRPDIENPSKLIHMSRHPKERSTILKDPEFMDMNEFICQNIASFSRIIKKTYPKFIVDIIDREETRNERKERLMKKQEEERLQNKENPNNPNKPNKNLIGKTDNNLKSQINTNNINNINKLEHLEIHNLIQENEPQMIHENNIGNISMNVWYTPFCTWIASLFQVIKDLNLRDIHDNSSIWSKIYPQEEGFPVYNPSGRYWVKLFYMGKYRKIEIDDHMPCNEHEEFLFPRCGRLEELWPALLTKALIKLFTHKIETTEYFAEEVGDSSILYALLGFIGEKADLMAINNDNFTVFQQVLCDEYFIEKKKYMVLYNPQQKQKLMKNNTANHSSTNTSNPTKRLSKKKVGMFVQPLKIKKSIIRGSQAEYNIKRKLSILKSQAKASTYYYNQINSMNNILQSQSMANSGNNNNIGSFCVVKDQEKNIKNYQSQNSTMLAYKSQHSINNDMKGNTNNLQHNQHQNSSASRFNSHNNKDNEKYMNKVFVDYAYSVTDFFTNFEFNMERLNQLDFSDIKEKLFTDKISYKQLSKEAKLKYILDLVELKKLHKQMREVRMQGLKGKGYKVSYFRIKSDSLGIHKFHEYYELKYSEEQIEAAKICILNRMKFPEINYYEKLLEKTMTMQLLKGDGAKIEKEAEENKEFHNKLHKHLDKHIDNVTITNNTKTNTNTTNKNLNLENDSRLFADSPLKKRKILSKASLASIYSINHDRGMNKKTNKIKDIYVQLMENQNESNYYNNKEICKHPLKRNDGEWVDLKMIVSLFTKMLVIHNPKKYSSSCILDETIKDPTKEIFLFDRTKSVFKFTPFPNHSNKNSNNKITSSMKSILFLFQANNSYNSFNPSLSIEVYNSDGTILVSSILFNHYYDTYQIEDIEFDQEYFAVIKGAACLNGFNLSIYADHIIENTSLSDYLYKIKDFKKI